MVNGEVGMGPNYQVLIVLCLFVGITGSTKQGSLDQMIALRPAKALECYTCNSERPEEKECLNFTNSKDEFKQFESTCESNATKCIVRRFSFSVSHADRTVNETKTFAVKRSCAAVCEPGCVIMGERTRLYVCNSCCDENLCNTGNGVESLVLHSSWNLFNLPALALCILNLKSIIY